jgi:hypothetical protein
MSKESDDLRNRCFPPEYEAANRLYFDSLLKLLKCFEEVTPDFINSIEVIKRHGFGSTLFAVNAIKKQVQIFESQLDDNE